LTSTDRGGTGLKRPNGITKGNKQALARPGRAMPVAPCHGLTARDASATDIEKKKIRSQKNGEKKDGGRNSSHNEMGERGGVRS